jgi:hypothetical protein
MKYNFEEKYFDDSNDLQDFNFLENDNLSEKSTGDDIINNIHPFKNLFDDFYFPLIRYEPKKNLNEIIFNPNIQNNICKRKDYILKKFKVNSSKYLIERLNQNDAKIKFYKLNFKYFTQNINYNQNYIWFFFKVKDIITLKNEKNKKAILKFEKKLKKSNNLNEINKLLNFTYYDYLFYYYEYQFKNDFINNHEYYEALKNYNYIYTMRTIGNNKKKKKKFI